MNDKDRAEGLAKAIEEMAQGRAPEHLDDEELRELVQIAKIRLDAAEEAADVGREAQGSVLERLIARLNLRRKREEGEPDSPSDADEDTAQIVGHGDPEDLDVKELRDVIALRRELADQAATISEEHREAVWQRVQARIQASQSENRGFFRLPFRRRDPEIDEFGATLDRMTLGEPIWEAPDSKLGDLLHVAQVRRAATANALTGFGDQQARVWARLRPRLMARLGLGRRRRVFLRGGAVRWPQLAAAGAALVLLAAALGPIPVTGVANHPVADFARFVGDRVGVIETTVPAAVPPITQVVESSDVTAEEAAELIGLPVYEPTFVPSGYHQVSSQYFSRPITADQQGTFVLAYEDAGLAGSTHTILIYQEWASVNSIVVEGGFAQGILFSAGTPATYVTGTWGPVGGSLRWEGDNVQTILFDLAGLRTIIHATDGELPMADLVAIGDSLARQVAPPTS